MVAGGSMQRSYTEKEAYMLLLHILRTVLLLLDTVDFIIVKLDEDVLEVMFFMWPNS